MESVYTPSSARAHLFGIIRQVNEQQAPVLISPANGGKGAVVVAQDDWRGIQETLYLQASGALARVREREADDSGATNVDDIDWDAL
jgi:prevent-host-death family protein